MFKYPLSKSKYSVGILTFIYMNCSMGRRTKLLLYCDCTLLYYISIFMGSILTFCLYRNPKSRQTLRTGPLKPDQSNWVKVQDDMVTKIENKRHVSFTSLSVGCNRLLAESQTGDPGQPFTNGLHVNPPHPQSPNWGKGCLNPLTPQLRALCRAGS